MNDWIPDRVRDDKNGSKMNEATTDTLYKHKFLSELDYRFARFLGRLDGTLDTKLLLAASLVSRERGEGHICIDLTAYAGTAIDMPESEPLFFPPLNAWLNVLHASPVVGRPGDYRPLILDGIRLYLYRYWDFEKKLAYSPFSLNKPTTDNCISP
jgi:exodeoxyribonuclease V alpha subunit